MLKYLSVIILILLNNILIAQFVQPRIDIPVNSELVSATSLYKANHSYSFNWVDYNSSEMQNYQINGDYWLLNYRIGSSLDEIVQFYTKIVKKHNGQILHNDNNNLYFKIPYPEGFFSWVHLNAYDKSYKLNIVEETNLNYVKPVEIDSSKIIQPPDAVFYYEEKMCLVESRYQKDLAKIINRLTLDPRLIIELKGFAAEDEGNGKENQQLAKKRLLQIKKELLSSGISLNRIFDLPYGDKYSEGYNIPDDHDKQRRVELYLRRVKK